MTSRPAAPESPLHCVTGALCKMDCDPDKRECEGFSEQGYVKLKRENDLAQTEIKGHMRVEDDLKRDLGLERESHEVTKRMLGDRDVRIAELEKLLAEHGTDAPGGIFS